MKYEAEDDYAASIEYYKNAIGTMLENVPKDPCLKRQASVKRRIYQYVRKTESLTQQDKAKVPHLRLFGALKDLKERYQVKGVLGRKVLLVKDTYNSQNVVIKTLQKSTSSGNNGKKSVLPIDVPHMSALLRYYETEDSIYLVLEYVEGGVLYEVIRQFMDNSKPVASERTTTPYGKGNVSVIKPSESFVQVRRASTIPPCTGEDDVFGSLEFVENDENDLYCVSKTGIEKISMSESLDSCEEAMHCEDETLTNSLSLLTKVSEKLEESSHQTTEAKKKTLEQLHDIEFKLNSRLMSLNEDDQHTMNPSNVNQPATIQMV